ncbi:hypothetical protein SCLCIDRAFT_471940 [Scleroderma citrinum Foug A]|uniref:Uncharacterized protein n=1 Tax=Scleroderma citrinum Foug A TaxID=1036808 RepID=A0A0C3EAY9_9AGAM|nr:hypothetical protein SCLCIDRAFT_471940 [Scleroderma citrinum Foug A]
MARKFYAGVFRPAIHSEHDRNWRRSSELQENTLDSIVIFADESCMNNGHGQLSGSGIRAEDGHPFGRALRVPGAAQMRNSCGGGGPTDGPQSADLTITASHRFPDPFPTTLGRRRLDRGSTRGMNEKRLRPCMTQISTPTRFKWVMRQAPKVTKKLMEQRRKG